MNTFDPHQSGNNNQYNSPSPPGQSILTFSSFSLKILPFEIFSFEILSFSSDSFFPDSFFPFSRFFPSSYFSPYPLFFLHREIFPFNSGVFSLSTKHIHFPQPVSPCDPESLSSSLSPSPSLSPSTLSCPCAHLLSSFPSLSFFLSPQPLASFSSIRFVSTFSSLYPSSLSHSLTNIHILRFLFSLRFLSFLIHFSL